MGFYDNGQGNAQAVVIAFGPSVDGEPSVVVAVFGPFSSEAEAEQWPGIPGFSGSGIVTGVYLTHEPPEWEEPS